jgi:ABC-type branched-subunit amino acid transport system substrate-binding protein
MKKKIGIGIIVALVVIVAVVITVNNKDAKQELTFGVISGMTGEYAAVGDEFLNGVTLAQEEWNLENPDKPIKIIVEDDEFDPKKGLSAYKKLVDIDKVDGLVNMTTFTIDVIEQDVVARNLPVSQGFIQTKSADDNIVQLWPSPDSAEIALGEYVKEQGYKNMVLFVSEDSSAFTVFADVFKRGYGLPLNELKVSSDITSIRSAALKAKEINPDAIVFIVAGDVGGLLINEFEKIAIDQKPRYVFDANIQVFFETSYRKVLGDTNRLNGSILYTVPTNYTKEFSDNYKERFGIAPTVGSETGYNSFKLLAVSHDKNQDKWIENMKKANFVGADGEIKLDENGVRIPFLKIGTIENGELPK